MTSQQYRGPAAGQLKRWQFHPLYARPMIQLELQAAAMRPKELGDWLNNALEQLPPDSVVRLKVHGKVSADVMNVLRAPSLRLLAPDSMNIDAWFPEYTRNYANR